MEVKIQLHRLWGPEQSEDAGLLAQKLRIERRGQPLVKADMALSEQVPDPEHRWHVHDVSPASTLPSVPTAAASSPP